MKYYNQNCCLLIVYIKTMQCIGQSILYQAIPFYFRKFDPEYKNNYIPLYPDPVFWRNAPASEWKKNNAFKFLSIYAKIRYNIQLGAFYSCSKRWTNSYQKDDNHKIGEENIDKNGILSDTNVHFFSLDWIA